MERRDPERKWNKNAEFRWRKTTVAEMIACKKAGTKKTIEGLTSMEEIGTSEGSDET
jgi:hypothetical protein